MGIIGPSGTGKSTILKIMAGLLQPDEGEVYVRGRLRRGLVGDDPAGDAELRLGLVFQSAALFDSLTVGENVGFTLYEHSNLPETRIRRAPPRIRPVSRGADGAAGRSSPVDAPPRCGVDRRGAARGRRGRELVRESLERVGLRGVEDRYPAQLSGGMKKRAALARAIISDGRDDGGRGPEEVVMYDEPTAGLDPIASTVVEDLMRDLHAPAHQGAAGGGPRISSYIVVTHQHSTIRRAVDRLVFLHQGRVVWEGSSAEFDTSEVPIVRQFARGDLDGPISY